MLNDLSKDLLALLEVIYEEVPNEITYKDLSKYMGKKKKFRKIFEYAKDKKYIKEKEKNISLTTKGKEHLFELKKYFSIKNNNSSKNIATISLIIAFMAVMLTGIPSAPKIYTDVEMVCPDLDPSGLFNFRIIGFGNVPTPLSIKIIGDGMLMKETNSITWGEDYDYYKYLGFEENYSFKAIIPTSQKGYSYTKTFGMAIVNDSLEYPTFTLKFHSRTYLLWTIPIKIQKMPVEFQCCYKKVKNREYSLIKC